MTSAKTDSSARNPPIKTRTQWILAMVFIRNLPLETPMDQNCSVERQQKTPNSFLCQRRSTKLWFRLNGYFRFIRVRALPARAL